ncbi:hypothetical protein H2199_000578 [Coniosporium tulheliwenetii]|uniref:Uncharacterized protein n=1 Tax=Coniosporium tulheliwenetii TaxID=3383036 RepID=A0ACC2ZQG7_9PEZI|nr:hypothetical protein H2199_000578 [Cladosporium sp. JES 115]
MAPAQFETSSPYRASRDRSPRRDRSRSPRRHHEHSRHKRRRTASPRPIVLPFNSRQLTKRDFAEYKPVFALYLDIQKQLVLEELAEDEVKGRWKSFVGKWNRGELAEGWYDPATKQKAVQSSNTVPTKPPSPARQRRPSPDYASGAPPQDADTDSDEDAIGPALPSQHVRSRRAGPAVPSVQDLELRNEQILEDSANYQADIRYERKVDRNIQKVRLEELVPRADPGSRERQLDKKREVAATHRSFREAKSPGAEEVGEGKLMGDDGIEAFKSRKKEMERKKNEREIRKEELLRARLAEREEMLEKHKAKEEKTMEMLKALARERFG